MKKVIQIRKKIKKIQVLVGKCPKCGREIEGSTEEQIKYNMETHIKTKHAPRTDLALKPRSAHLTKKQEDFMLLRKDE